MSKHLLLAERDLIDCLRNKKVLEFNELKSLMSFDTKFLTILINNLKGKDIINIGDFNNININEKEIQKINRDRETAREEAKDIHDDLIDAYFDECNFISDLIIRGFWMSEFEYKVFLTKKADFLGFIRSLSENTPSKNRVKHLISFSSCDYGGLSRYSLENSF